MSWNQRSKNPEMNLEILDTREITLGIIGPWSLAKEAQDAVHDATTVPKFYGWSHQLNNEPAIQLAMDKNLKVIKGITLSPPVSLAIIYLLLVYA
jgi:lipid A 3-O-deacylase